MFDDIVVDMDTPEHARLWTEQLGVSIPALQLALKKAGPLLNDVREELGLARVYIFPRDERIIQRLMANGLIR